MRFLNSHVVAMTAFLVVGFFGWVNDADYSEILVSISSGYFGLQSDRRGEE